MNFHWKQKDRKKSVKYTVACIQCVKEGIYQNTQKVPIKIGKLFFKFDRENVTDCRRFVSFKHENFKKSQVFQDSKDYRGFDCYKETQDGF